MVWWREVLNNLFRDERCAKFWVLLEIFNIWSKFLSFKGVSPRKKWQNPKKKLDLKFSWYDEGKYLFNLIKMNNVQNFGCWWKYLVFGRNSWVLKVLAHEKSGEIPKKKLRSWIFMVWWREVFIILDQDERCAKFWLLIKIFTFWSKFLSFKGVSPRKKRRNPKRKIRS